MADGVYVGALVNRQAIVNALLRDEKPIYLVCAGTDGRVTSEDILCAGAIVAEIERRTGSREILDDLAMMARDLWNAHSSTPERLLDADIPLQSVGQLQMCRVRI